MMYGFRVEGLESVTKARQVLRIKGLGFRVWSRDDSTESVEGLGLRVKGLEPVTKARQVFRV